MSEKFKIDINDSSNIMVGDYGTQNVASSVDNRQVNALVQDLRGLIEQSELAESKKAEAHEVLEKSLSAELSAPERDEAFRFLRNCLADVANGVSTVASLAAMF